MAQITKVLLYKLNNQWVDVLGLQNESTGTYLNAATVTLTLRDPKGVAVSGCSNLSAVYVASSNGNYRCQFPNTFDPPASGRYVLAIDAVQDGEKLHIEKPATVLVREG